MDNLHRKCFMTREKEGRAYRYLPTKGRAEHTAELMHELLRGSGDRSVTLLKFLDTMSPKKSSYSSGLLVTSAVLLLAYGRDGWHVGSRFTDARPVGTPLAPASDRGLAGCRRLGPPEPRGGRRRVVEQLPARSCRSGSALRSLRTKLKDGYPSPGGTVAASPVVTAAALLLARTAWCGVRAARSDRRERTTCVAVLGLVARSDVPRGCPGN